MAYCSVPRDLSKVRNKIAFNLTKRQLICFGSAAAIGVPAYILTRGIIGNSAAALLMIFIMLPLFFLGIYEKDGQPAEMILRNFLRCKFIRNCSRPYKTENLYEIMQKGDNNIAAKGKTAAKTPVAKRPAGKGKPR